MHNTNCITVCVKVCAHVREGERESLCSIDRKGAGSSSSSQTRVACAPPLRDVRIVYGTRRELFSFRERKERRKGNARDVSFFFFLSRYNMHVLCCRSSLLFFFFSKCSDYANDCACKCLRHRLILLSFVWRVVKNKKKKSPSTRKLGRVYVGRGRHFAWS